MPALIGAVKCYFTSPISPLPSQVNQGRNHSPGQKTLGLLIREYVGERSGVGRDGMSDRIKREEEKECYPDTSRSRPDVRQEEMWNAN